MTTIRELLKEYEVKVDEDACTTEITSALWESGIDTLYPLFDHITESSVIVPAAAEDPNDDILRATLTYVLVEAVQTDDMAIDDAKIKNAFIKAEELITTMKPTIQKRQRTPDLYPDMVQYVKDNPDAQKQQVVMIFSKQYPGKAETTLTQYYHKARREVGLKPNGKPGRNRSDTYPTIRTMVEGMIQRDPSVSVDGMKKEVSKSFPDIKSSSIQNYVYRARKEVLTK